MEKNELLDTNRKKIEDFIRIHFDFIKGEHDLDLILQNAYIVFFKSLNEIKDFNSQFYHQVFLFSLNYIHLLNFENRVAISLKTIEYIVDKYKVYPSALHISCVCGIDINIANDILNYADSNYQKEICNHRKGSYNTFEDDVIDQIESKNNKKIKRKTR